ncbi:hypothetical protein XFF6166_10135 [Xanthomonas citri pv. fuscans]|nr:hypothetical protein XFF6166_10135 [Xanthomonas citri pv. fuscans]SOO11152.1 hypothetical protein XFF6970_70081 [Xanthomonas citri pv. fuscans]SOO45834.1 hypothetical protein XFF1815_900173 [Xanthomonas citri pv. fuscans]
MAQSCQPARRCRRLARLRARLCHLAVVALAQRPSARQRVLAVSAFESAPGDRVRRMQTAASTHAGAWSHRCMRRAEAKPVHLGTSLCACARGGLAQHLRVRS